MTQPKKQLSIFDLKLKILQRKLKPSKIEKILQTCYKESDHTESLKRLLAEGYTSTSGSGLYSSFLNDFSSFLTGIIQSNIKPELKDLNDENKKTIYSSFKLNPGDIYPNFEELESIVRFIELHIKNKEVPKISIEVKKYFDINHMDIISILKQVVIKTYLDIEGKFPSPHDFLKQLKKVSPIWENELKELEFNYTTNNNQDNNSFLNFHKTLLSFIEKTNKLNLENKISLYSTYLNEFSIFSNIWNYFKKEFMESKKYVVKPNYVDDQLSSVDIFLINPLLKTNNFIIAEENLSSRTDQILCSIFEKNDYSSRFKFLIKENTNNSSQNTLCFEIERRQTKILMSKNFIKEFESFCDYIKKNKLGQIYLGKNNFGNDSLNITFDLEFSVDEVNQKDLIRLLS